MDHDVYADQSSDRKSIRDQFREGHEKHPLRMRRKRFSRTNRTVLQLSLGLYPLPVTRLRRRRFLSLLGRNAASTAATTSDP